LGQIVGVPRIAGEHQRRPVYSGVIELARLGDFKRRHAAPTGLLEATILIVTSVAAASYIHVERLS
jgi:hypothetical protein